MKGFGIAAVWLAMCLSLDGLADSRRGDPVNPVMYVSRSGAVKCLVDPTADDGSGAANYRVTRNGELVWEGLRDFTIYNGVVAEDGRVAGYAYPYGLNGFAPREKKDQIFLALLDPSGKVLLNEGKERQPVVMHGWPQPYGGGVALDEAGDRFWIWLSDGFRKNDPEKWVSFRLSTGASLGTGKPEGLEVKEIPHNGKALVPSFDLKDIPERKLRKLGEFTMEKDGSGSEIRNILEFKFDGEGRIGFLRQETLKAFSFVLVEADGAPVRTMPLEMLTKFPSNDAPHLAWVEGDRWVITSSEFGENGKSVGWWLETEGGKISQMAKFDATAIEQIIGGGQGGFITLGTLRHKYSMEDDLSRYSRDGQLIWRKRQDGYGGKKEELLSPNDIAVTGNGEVVVLDVIRHTLQYFSLEGKYLRTVDLDKQWKRKANYPADLSADMAGGLLVKDIHGTPEFVRMDANGEVRSQFSARHPDGRTLDARRGVRVSPNGRVWVSDGESLARLTDEGVVDLVLGAAPVAEKLGNVAEIFVDQNGSLFAVDDRTGSVHRFNAKGDKTRVYRTKPDDFKESLSSAVIAVEPKGGVFVGAYDKPEFVHFAEDGKRLEDVKFSDWSMPNVVALSNGNFLVIEYRKALLLNAERKVVRKIERRLDRCWFETAHEGFATKNGGFVIVSEPAFWSGEPWPVNLYSAKGEAEGMIVMPGECKMLAVAQSVLLTLAKNNLVGIGFDGRPLFKAAIPETTENMDVFATLEGKEFWLVSEGRKVSRFGLED